MSSCRRDTGRAARTPLPRTSLPRTLLLGLSSLALGATVFALPGGTAAVAAPPLTVADAKAQIEQLQVDAEALDQDYLGVKEQVDQAKAQLKLKQQDTKAQAAKVAATRRQVGQVALAQFQNRNLDTAAQLFLTSDTGGFLNQISTVEQVGSNQNSVLQRYQQQQAGLADLQKSSQTDLLALERKESDLAKLKAESDKKIADSKAVLAKLTAQERAALAAQRKKEAAEARAAAARAAAADNASSSRSNATSTGNAASTGAAASATADRTPSASSSRSGSRSGVGSGKGATALAFAKNQIGKPYRFGAAGPGAYDCSGLTSAAWRAAGVSLTRTSQSQFSDGVPVSRSDLRPGDLVFFYGSRPSHVAIYAGNGMVVHAPNSRSSVKYAPLSSMPFSGARRPA